MQAIGRSAIIHGAIILAGFVAILWLSPAFKYDTVELQRPVYPVWAGLTLIGIVFLSLAQKLIDHSSNLSKNHWVILLGIGLFCRVVMLPSTPILENDFERYFLDGQLVLSGMNPYDTLPEDIQERMSDSDFLKKNPNFAGYPAKKSVSQVNHPHIKTIYPPLAQLSFAVTQWIAPWSMIGWKCFLLLLEIGLIWTLFQILLTLRKPSHWIFLFWLNPIVVKEFYNSAHMDLILLLPLALALWAYLRSYKNRAVLCLSLAASAKFWPVLLLPFFLRRESWRSAARLAIVFGLGLLLFLLPMILSSLDNQSGVVAFGRFWAMNDALFNGAVKVLTSLKISDYDGAFAAVRIGFLMVTVLLLVFLIRHKASDDRQLMRQMMIFMAGFFILLPTQFPWYFTWLLMFLVIVPQMSLLLYSAVIFTYYLRFHYQYRDVAEFFDNRIAFVEHGIVYGALIFDAWSMRKVKK